jgi:hypothetical protein
MASNCTSVCILIESPGMIGWQLSCACFEGSVIAVLFSSDLSNATQSVTHRRAEIASDQGLEVESGEPGTGMEGAGMNHCTNSAFESSLTFARFEGISTGLGKPDDLVLIKLTPSQQGRS